MPGTALTAYQVGDDTAYPAVLLPRGVNDPRVDVWTSLKFAACVQSAGRQASVATCAATLTDVIDRRPPFLLEPVVAFGDEVVVLAMPRILDMHRAFGNPLGRHYTRFLTDRAANQSPTARIATSLHRETESWSPHNSDKKSRYLRTTVEYGAGQAAAQSGNRDKARYYNVRLLENAGTGDARPELRAAREYLARS